MNLRERAEAFVGLCRLNLNDPPEKLVDTLVGEFEQVQRLAGLDDLTELPGRTAFWGALNRALRRRSRGADRWLSVVVIDVDHFK